MSVPFILLVNPWIHDFAAYDLWMRPVGLLCIAGFLKKSGFGVHLIDCLDPSYPMPSLKQPRRKYDGRGHFLKQTIKKPEVLKNIPRNYRRYGMTPAAFDDQLRSLPTPQAILVTSMMTYWYPGVFETIHHVRDAFPRTPIILGGVYATLCAEHARRFSGADYVVKGSEVSALLSILEALMPVPRPHVHDEFLQPECSLLSSKQTIPLLTSRGCPLHCSYCASSLLFPSFQQSSPALISSEIERWVESSLTTDFVFFDDALLVRPEEHIIPLLQDVLRRGMKARFHVPNGLHVRQITYTVAALMKQAGFVTLRLGLESVDAHLQVKTGAKVTCSEFRRTAGILKDVGFSSQEVGVYVLAGLPGQEFSSVHESIEFVLDHGLRPLIAEYSPIPGTALWQDALRQSSFPLAREPLFHNNTLLPCQWDRFTPEDVKRLKRIAHGAA